MPLPAVHGDPPRPLLARIKVEPPDSSDGEWVSESDEERPLRRPKDEPESDGDASSQKHRAERQQAVQRPVTRPKPPRKLRRPPPVDRKPVVQRKIPMKAKEKPAVKPKCPFCGRANLPNGMLEAHVDAHRPARERPFVCSICGLLQAHANIRNKHEEAVHNFWRSSDDQDRPEAMRIDPALSLHLRTLGTNLRNVQRRAVSPTTPAEPPPARRTRSALAASGGSLSLNIKREPVDEEEDGDSSDDDHEPQQRRSSDPCEVCGLRCSTAYNLKGHLMAHTSDGPFVCSVCGVKCSHSCTRNSHERQVHQFERNEWDGLRPEAVLIRKDQWKNLRNIATNVLHVQANARSSWANGGEPAGGGAEWSADEQKPAFRTLADRLLSGETDQKRKSVRWTSDCSPNTPDLPPRTSDRSRERHTQPTPRFGNSSQAVARSQSALERSHGSRSRAVGRPHSSRGGHKPADEEPEPVQKAKQLNRMTAELGADYQTLPISCWEHSKQAGLLLLRSHKARWTGEVALKESSFAFELCDLSGYILCFSRDFDQRAVEWLRTRANGIEFLQLMEFLVSMNTKTALIMTADEDRSTIEHLETDYFVIL